MKQEASKKSKLWLWLVIGVVALLAVAGVVLALVLGSGNDEPAGPTGGRPELYWNIDKAIYTKDSQFSTREPGEDGMYHVRYAINGEIVELPVADKQLVNYIDMLDAMGVVKDADGTVVDVMDPKDIATEVGKSIYIKSVEGDKIIANSSLMMNGLAIDIAISDLTQVYDVTPEAEAPGRIVDPSQLKTMATVTVYANDLGEVTHIYLTSLPTESKVYWRVPTFYSYSPLLYNSTDKVSTRETDENGVYSIDFMCDGEQVTLKTKDKEIARKIDATDKYYAHFGFAFDEEGYIVKEFYSEMGIGALMPCDGWDVIAMDGDYVTVERLLKNDGSTWSGTIPADCPIYDASLTALAEGRFGQKVDSLQAGDRITVWTDTDGKPVMIYISLRKVDSPAYWIPTRKYNATKRVSTRERGASGYFEVELLKAGETKNRTYYVKDQETINYLDSQVDRMVGLKVGAGNVIEYVYNCECITGRICATQGSPVTYASGLVVSKISYGKPDKTANYILTPDCKVYNVSTCGKYGEETTVRAGDIIYAYRQPTGEISLVFVSARQLGADSMYYNLERMYNSTKKITKRKPDENGWYTFLMAHKGRQVTLRTKSLEVASKVDSFDPAAMALEVSGDVILAAHDPTYAYSGKKVASGYRYRSTGADGTVNTNYGSGDTYKEETFKMSATCAIYNVSPVFDKFQGERIYSLRDGDLLTVFTNIYGEAEVVYVRQRIVEHLYWKLGYYYDSDKGVTTRVPDADGYYWYDLAVNGEVKTFKTKNKKIANSIDSYRAAFGLHVKGDNEITGFVLINNVRNVKANSITDYNVTKIEGNTVTLTYNRPDTKFGDTKTIKINSSTKIFDVSPSAEKFGQKVKLQVGDTIRSYLSTDGVHDAYIYIKAHSTRKGGEYGYCEVCGKNVTWNPFLGDEKMTAQDGHWYLTGDTTSYRLQYHAVTGRNYTLCLDLNGHTLTREGTGRVFRISAEETLNIFDSVGGGKIQGRGGDSTGTANCGGVMMITYGGVVNLYSGTVEMQKVDGVQNYYGGVLYMYSKNSVFNMYGGEITGGVSHSNVVSKGGAAGSGGNVYITSGTFNMHGGTVSNGEAYGAIRDKVNDDGTTTVQKINGYGGNFYVSDNATLNITGGTVVGGKAIMGTRVETKDGQEVVTESGSSGGNIYLGKGATLNIGKGVVIANGTAKYGGGNIYATGKDATVTLDGGTVTGGKITATDAGSTAGGGNIAIVGKADNLPKLIMKSGSVGGEVTVNGQKVSGGTSAGKGGNIHVAYGEAEISGGTVTGGVSTYPYTQYHNRGGGNISIQDGGLVTVSGTALVTKGNSQNNTGGNVWVNKGTLKVTGGQITEGQAGHKGENIAVIGSTSGEMTISGGSMTEGSVYVTGANAAVNLSGTPVISELQLNSGVKATLGELKDGAEIAVTASGVFTNPCDNAQNYLDAKYVKTFDPNGIIEVTEQKELYVVDAIGIDPSDVYEWINENADWKAKFTNATESVDADCPVCGGLQTWKPLEKNTSTSQKTLNAGHYYLAEADGLTQEAGYNHNGGTICLYLNGKSVETTKTNRVAFAMDNTDQLNIMGDGTVSGARAGTYGNGVIDVAGDAIVNLCGGTYECTAANAINVSVRGDGACKVNFYDGMIHRAGTTAGLCVRVQNNGEFNMYGGTVSGGTTEEKGGNFYIYGNKADMTAKLNIYDGTVTGGTSTNGGNIYLMKDKAEATVALTVSGGSVTEGTVYVSDPDAAVNLSGAPVIADLQLARGVKVTLGELTDGADIAVTAEGVFTNPCDNAQNYLDAKYVKPFDSNETIDVTEQKELYVVEDSEFKPDNVYESINKDADWKAMFTNATGSVDAVCPWCGGTAVEWKPLEKNTTANQKTLNAGHYYLAEADGLTQEAGYNHNGGTICLYLNGKSIETTKTNRVTFAMDSTDQLNIMGDGTVSGARAGTYGNGVIDVAGDAIVNLCGGTYECTAANAINVSVRGDGACKVNFYDGTIQRAGTTAGLCVRVQNNGQFNMYGGTVKGGSTTGKGGNFYVYGNKSNMNPQLNISGGKILGGRAANGGNIYAWNDVDTAVVRVAISDTASVEGGFATESGGNIYVMSNKAGANIDLTVSGGTVKEGSVFVTGEDAAVNLSGAPVVTDLQLDSGVEATLGELTDGADITVTADGVFTITNENAQSYVDARYIKPATGKAISVNADKTLSMAAATVLQMLAKALNIL